jgi:arginyl-tRNA synthetase
LHLGNGRGGFYGDCLSKVLRKAGFDVTNEYFVNDAGEQVLKLGHSVLKDSEAVYAGEYIDELNEKYKNISERCMFNDEARSGRKSSQRYFRKHYPKNSERKNAD